MSTSRIGKESLIYFLLTTLDLDYDNFKEIIKAIEKRLKDIIFGKNFYNIESLLYILRKITFNWIQEEDDEEEKEDYLRLVLNIISKCKRNK